MRESSATGRFPESPAGVNDTELDAASNRGALVFPDFAARGVNVTLPTVPAEHTSVDIGRCGMEFVLAGSHLSVSHPPSATEQTGIAESVAAVIAIITDFVFIVKIL